MEAVAAAVGIGAVVFTYIGSVCLDGSNPSYVAVSSSWAAS